MSKPLRRRPHAKAEFETAKIAKLLRLMLSSDQQGEVFAAAGALRRTLAAAGLDLHDLADATAAGLKPAEPERRWGPPQPNPGDWQALAWFCFYYRDRLRTDRREYICDVLLGVAFEDGVCTRAHLGELQRLAAVVMAAR